LAFLGRQETALWHLLGVFLVSLGVLASFFTSVPAPPDIKPIARFLSHEFHTAYLVLGILVLFLLAYRAKSKSAALLVVAVIGVESLIYILVREALWSGFHLAPRPSGGSGGFPSGHTACHCALAYILTERFPKASPLFYSVASAVAWSRVGDGGHYAYQVLAGAILGFAVALLITPRFSSQPVAAPADGTA
jgi:membrane-associated phospholipid phosphatase